MQGAEADAALADAPPEAQPLAALMRVQLSLAAGDRSAVAARLADLLGSELRYRPAVVATLSSLQVRHDPRHALRSNPTTPLRKGQKELVSCSMRQAFGHSQYPSTFRPHCRLRPPCKRLRLQLPQTLNIRYASG